MTVYTKHDTTIEVHCDEPGCERRRCIEVHCDEPGCERRRRITGDWYHAREMAAVEGWSNTRDWGDLCPDHTRTGEITDG